MKQIFISYAPEDTEQAEDLYKKLSDKGFRPWMDKKDIKAGEKTETITHNAIRKSDFFLACLSKQSVKKRGQFQSNFKKAAKIFLEKLDTDIYLIPVRFDNCEIPDNLNQIQCVGLYKKDGFSKLVKSIQTGIKQYANDRPDNPVSSKEQNHQTCSHAQTNNPWIFECSEKDQAVRYFLEIEKQDTTYNGRIHKGNTDKTWPLNDLKLGPEHTVEIKGQHIQLQSLIRKLADFDGQWLKNQFDDQGQYEFGLHLYSQIFGTLISKEIQPPNGETEIRIITDDDHIARIPWNLLANNSIFLSNSGWSVSLSHTTSLIDCELPPSPKILIIAPQPTKLNPTNAESHLEELEELLSSADSSHTRDNKLHITTTRDDFKEFLKNFQPDIIYFYGYGKGDTYNPQLIFADKKNKQTDMPVSDLIHLLKTIPDNPPLLAYINCCQGNADGFNMAGVQLEKLVTAVVFNRTATDAGTHREALISAAQAQGAAFWKNILLKGMPPHKAVSQIRNQMPGKLDISPGNTRCITPVLHCHYSQWTSHLSKPPPRLERDPHWRLKLDRVNQFSQIFFQTHQMFKERKPRALSYLWYGEKDQGIELFHKRLTFELQENLNNVIMYEVNPEWPTDMYDPHQSFTDMIKQAFQITHFEHLAARIRTHTRSVAGRQTLVYVRHRPVTSSYIFHPKYIKTYLEWWNLYFLPRLPDQTHALLGISYEVTNPAKFRDLLIKKERLNETDLSETVFYILDEMEKINRKDLFDFLKTHNIQLPPDLRDGILEKILQKTRGNYERVLDELKELERRAWRLRKEAEKAEQEKIQGEDEYDDVF
ncbi:MAG: TIR domain-containing protein [Desulfobacteraceae bacterium]|nr:TIR domain-containing protein [Desulfobacteraceae bacterium]